MGIVNVHIEFNFRCPWLFHWIGASLIYSSACVLNQCTRTYVQAVRMNVFMCACIYFALSKMNLCETKIIGNGRCHLDTDGCVRLLFSPFYGPILYYTHSTTHIPHSPYHWITVNLSTLQCSIWQSQFHFILHYRIWSCHTLSSARLLFNNNSKRRVVSVLYIYHVRVFIESHRMDVHVLFYLAFNQCETPWNGKCEQRTPE